MQTSALLGKENPVSCIANATSTHSRHTDAHEMRRQAMWEVDATNRAIKRFREDALSKAPHELPSGRRALVETIGPVQAWFARWLSVAAKNPATVAKPPRVHARLLAFQAETLAVIAVSTALRAGQCGEGRNGQTLMAFGKRVCAALRDQQDHDEWIAEGTGKNAPKDRADLVRMFQRANPDASSRQWRALCKRLEIARSSPWTDDEDAAAEVAGVFAEALGGSAQQGPTRAGPPIPWWFEVRGCGEGAEHRKPLCVLLSDHAEDRMADADARAEVARPDMLPMLIAPRDWVYDEKETK